MEGPYYWHIKSGTIQREPPLWPKDEDKAKELKTPVSFDKPIIPNDVGKQTKGPNQILQFIGKPSPPPSRYPMPRMHVSY